jgi:hypothetical protein
MSSPQELLHKSNPSSPHDLVTMQNVSNVLDLHKEHHQQQQLSPDHHHHQQQQLQQAIIDQSHSHQHPSDLSQLENGLKEENLRLLQQQHSEHENRLISDGRIAEQQQQILAKITGADDPIFRLLDSGLVSKIVGENQQIVSSDYVNGEHHIVTRNVNGEHILTRIVNTSVDHGKVNGNDDLYNSFANGQGVINNNKSDDPKAQIIFTPDTQNSVISKNPHQYDPEMQKQIDLIYEDGNKTVVYATGVVANPGSPGIEHKPLELFSSGEFANGQVLVQGNLQYTPQIQPDGSTVYVVSELIDDINGDLPR